MGLIFWIIAFVATATLTLARTGAVTLQAFVAVIIFGHAFCGFLRVTVFWDGLEGIGYLEY